MSIIRYDPGEWETEVRSTICLWHRDHPGENYAGCGCSTSVISRHTRHIIAKEPNK